MAAIPAGFLPDDIWPDVEPEDLFVHHAMKRIDDLAVKLDKGLREACLRALLTHLLEVEARERVETESKGPEFSDEGDEESIGYGIQMQDNCWVLADLGLGPDFTVYTEFPHQTSCSEYLWAMILVLSAALAEKRRREDDNAI